MNELSPYLRKLLLEHDCAIIPDFGGFVMQRHAARHATADQQMLPPSKTVGFNALLGPRGMQVSPHFLRPSRRFRATMRPRHEARFDARP